MNDNLYIATSGLLDQYIDILEVSKTVISLRRDTIFYVMPTKYEKIGQTFFEDKYAQTIKNFMILNALGIISEDNDKVNYYIDTFVKESIYPCSSESHFIISFNVFSMKDVHIFHIKLKVTSSENNNFHYYTTVISGQSDYLIQTGLNYLLDKYFKKLFIGGY